MIAAVDIGGTKTLVAVFDEHGTIVEEHKFPTNQDYDVFREDLATNVAELSTPDFSRAVVAIPGRIDRDNGVGLSMGNLGWKNIPMQAECEKLFHAPTFVENDAKLAGLSEALLIRDRFSKVLYITISTGIGVALIIDGKIDTEIGDRGGSSVLLEHQGKLQAWESFASGKAIVKTYGKHASEIDDPAIWKKIVRDLSVGMIDLIAVLEPEVVVIGGGVGSHFDRFGDQLTEQLRQYEVPMMAIPPILAAKHPEEAVIYGCYEYAKQQV
jgi:predicted NBD/HSP70 family sugar kinase